MGYAAKILKIDKEFRKESYVESFEEGWGGVGGVGGGGGGANFLRLNEEKSRGDAVGRAKIKRTKKRLQAGGKASILRPRRQRIAGVKDPAVPRYAQDCARKKFSHKLDSKKIDR